MADLIDELGDSTEATPALAHSSPKPAIGAQHTPPSMKRAPDTASSVSYPVIPSSASSDHQPAQARDFPLPPSRSPSRSPPRSPSPSVLLPRYSHSAAASPFVSVDRASMSSFPGPQTPSRLASVVLEEKPPATPSPRASKGTGPRESSSAYLLRPITPVSPISSLHHPISPASSDTSAPLRREQPTSIAQAAVPPDSCGPSAEDSGARGSESEKEMTRKSGSTKEPVTCDFASWQAMGEIEPERSRSEVPLAHLECELQLTPSARTRSHHPPLPSLAPRQMNQHQHRLRSIQLYHLWAPLLPRQGSDRSVPRSIRRTSRWSGRSGVNMIIHCLLWR